MPQLKNVFGIFAVVLLVFLQSAVQGCGDPPEPKTIEELDSAIESARECVISNPDDPDALNELGNLLIRRGRYGDAETHLLHSIDIKTTIQGYLGLIELSSRTYRFDRMESYLAEATACFPEEEYLLFCQASLDMLKTDFEKAESMIQYVLKKNPESALALHYLASLRFSQNRFDESERLINKSLNKNPQIAETYLLQATLFQEKQNQESSKAAVKKALSCDPLNAEVISAWAVILFQEEGKLKEGAEQALLALEIDPYLLSAHDMLGRGGSPNPYPLPTFTGNSVQEKQIERALKEGSEFLKNREYASAEKAFLMVLQIDDTNLAAMNGLGAVHFHRAEYDKGLERYFNILKIDPYYGLAHYGISLILNEKIDAFNLRFPEMEAEFARKQALEIPLITEIISDFDQCDENVKKIIRLAVAPLKNYLKAVKVAGSTIYLMDMHELLWQCPHMSNTKGTRDSTTFRLTDDMKGLQSYPCTAVSKAELREVKHARYNVFAHEFAHQVHYIFTRKQKAALKRLYLSAREEKRTLDPYARTNEYEYFAQGYEAFVSEEKFLDLMGHTRHELITKDPDLFQFINDLGNQASYVENEITGISVKAEHIGGKKAIDIYLKALEAYGNHAVLLTALGNAYRELGQHEKAFELHERAIDEFPYDVWANIALANDYLIIRKDTEQAIQILEELEVDHKNCADLYFHIGTLYYYLENWHSMDLALDKGIRIDPLPDFRSGGYPNPYHLLAWGRIKRENYYSAEHYLNFSLKEIGASGFRVGNKSWLEYTAFHER